jgi:hypothetical protein
LGGSRRTLEDVPLYATTVELGRNRTHVIAFVPPAARIARRRPYLASHWIEYTIQRDDYRRWRGWIALRPRLRPSMVLRSVEVPATWGSVTASTVAAIEREAEVVADRRERRGLAVQDTDLARYRALWSATRRW